MARSSGESYREAGVDIDLAQALLKRVKRKLSAARRPEMLAPIGGFGGLFQLDLRRYRQPVLVSSIDGVGTKLMVAMMAGRYDSVGADLVNHCINDVAVQGAEPLYFLDYIGIGKLRSPLYEQVLSGIAAACVKSGCALLGGETAEMPGMYGNDFDLVGVITGVVERSRLITGARIAPGHLAIGLGSTGLHTNGYSLARRVLFEKCGYEVDTELKELGGTVGDALLQPHLSYWPAIRRALQLRLPLDGIAHITGGGLYDNVPRILPPGVAVRFDVREVPVPPIFSLICEEGAVAVEEAYRVFNMGIGMVWFVPPTAATKTLTLIRRCGFRAYLCGEAVKARRAHPVVTVTAG